MNQKNTTIVFLILAIVYALVSWFDYTFVAMLIKPLPVFLFAVVAWSRSTYNRLLSVGLVLSGVGDIFLANYINMFIPGLASFLVAHILYSIAFVSRERRLHIIVGLLSYAFGVVCLLLFYDSLGEMLIPVTVYIYVILTMIWRSIAQRSSSKQAVWAAYGALLFGFSDSVIGFDKFLKPIAIAPLLIMLSYWGAQYLFFLSLDTKEELKEEV